MQCPDSHISWLGYLYPIVGGWFGSGGIGKRDAGIIATAGGTGYRMPASVLHGCAFPEGELASGKCRFDDDAFLLGLVGYGLDMEVHAGSCLHGHQSCSELESVVLTVAIRIGCRCGLGIVDAEIPHLPCVIDAVRGIGSEVVGVGIENENGP